MITIDAVEAGDLIFFGAGDPRDTPGIGKNGSFAHVGIISDSLADSKLHMIHQTTKGGNAWGPIEQGLTGGSLKETVVPYQASAWEITQPHDPDALANSKIARVLHCQKPNLQSRAAYYANRWNQFFVPFGGERGNVASEHEKRFATGEELINEHRQLFKRAGKYRAIKYAARRNGFPCYPTDEGQGPFGQGMFCSMFVAVCYQVAGLESLVTPADATDFTLRVSDKKCSKRSEIEKCSPKATSFDVHNFEKYTQFLRENNPYDTGIKATHQSAKQKKFTYKPSIAYWNYAAEQIIETTDWNQFMTEGMMVDSKVIYPTGLYESLLSDKDGWIDMGNLVGLADSVRPTEHIKHKAPLANYAARQFNRA